MSSVIIAGDVSGTVTLQAPSAAGSTVLTLPATTGTVAVLPTATSVLPEASGGTGTTTGYYGFKNRIINGAMVIDQRNAGAAVSTAITSAPYSVDRWLIYGTQAAKFTCQQNQGSVTPPAGFANYLGTTSSSAYSVISTDIFEIQQRIEGYNIADLAWGTASAATVTLSFWVRSSLTGTFGGSLGNGSRSYPFTYTISSANTWEQKTVTVAGDTSGTWAATTASGIAVTFSLGSGSTYNGTSGAWAAGNLLSATGATSVVGTSGATFYITGVQLEKGSTATSFDYRPYGTELALCQRYYYKVKAKDAASRLGMGWVTTTTTALVQTTFPVTMRTNPTSLEQSGTAGDYRIEYTNTAQTCSTVPIFTSADAWGAITIPAVSSGLTAGQGAFLRSINSNAYLAWSVEL